MSKSTSSEKKFESLSSILNQVQRSEESLLEIQKSPFCLAHEYYEHVTSDGSYKNRNQKLIILIIKTVHLKILFLTKLGRACVLVNHDSLIHSSFIHVFFTIDSLESYYNYLSLVKTAKK